VDIQLDTRARILRTTLRLFLERGYQHTSLRHIGEQLGLSKTAILYHFPTKQDLAATVVDPFLSDLEALLDRVSRLSPRKVRWSLVEGMLDVYLAHRSLLRIMMRDAGPFLQGAAFHRLMATTARANAILTGPDSGLRQRVRAAQVTAVLTDPVLLLEDVPAAELRVEILVGVRRLLGYAAVRRGDAKHDGSPGRPRAMTEQQLASARELRAEGTRSMAQIAEVLGVSRATLYRYLRPGGGPATN
jgi:AcrR family transcriptional regulator